MKKVVGLLVMCLLLNGCSKDDNYDFDRFYVASKKLHMELDYDQGVWGEGYVVSITQSDEWRFFPYEIEGFDYLEGNEYLIHVKRFEFKDEVSGKVKYRYVLHSLIESRPAQSVDLPTTEIGRALVASKTLRPRDKPLEDWFMAKLQVSDAAADGSLVGVEWAELWQFWVSKNNLFINHEVVDDPTSGDERYKGIGNGFEYEVEYQRSNVDGNLVMNKEGSYIRIVKVIERIEKESEGPFPTNLEKTLPR